MDDNRIKYPRSQITFIENAFVETDGANIMIFPFSGGHGVTPIAMNSQVAKNLANIILNTLGNG